MPEELKEAGIFLIASTNLLYPLRTDQEIHLLFEVGDLASFPRYPESSASSMCVRSQLSL